MDKLGPYRCQLVSLTGALAFVAVGLLAQNPVLNEFAQPRPRRSGG